MMSAKGWPSWVQSLKLMQGGVPVTSTFISAPDGLKLHARCWGARAAAGLPVICLPGLARTTADFDALAPALAGDGRRVIAIDSRGRGRSEYDRDAANYN